MVENYKELVHELNNVEQEVAKQLETSVDATEDEVAEKNWQLRHIRQQIDMVQ